MNNQSRQKSGPIVLLTKSRALQFLVQVVLKQSCLQQPSEGHFLPPLFFLFLFFNSWLSSPFLLLLIRVWRLTELNSSHCFHAGTHHVTTVQQGCKCGGFPRGENALLVLLVGSYHLLLACWKQILQSTCYW